MIKLDFAKCCGNCVHASKPKKLQGHFAHYDVAKTERWCYKHSCYITRETVCDDFEVEQKKGGVPACKRVMKFNEKLKLLREIQERFKRLGLLDNIIWYGERGLLVQSDTNKIIYKYKNWDTFSSSVGCKDRDMPEYLKFLSEYADEYEKAGGGSK